MYLLIKIISCIFLKKNSYTLIHLNISQNDKFYNTNFCTFLDCEYLTKSF